MASFSALGIGLSLLFGCILLGLVVELYYMLWWKKRFIKTEHQNNFTKHTTDLPHFFCFKTLNFSANKIPKPQEQQDPELGLGLGLGLGLDIPNGLLQKGIHGEEEGVESELMRAHNLCGPPRFLFTIKEETKEDLDSIGTPLASSPLKPQSLGSYIGDDEHGFRFNPLFESTKEADINRFRSSPPPKFKFMRDAEEKLMRKLEEESEKKKFGLKIEDSVQDSIGLKASSQILPLASSPSESK